MTQKLGTSLGILTCLAIGVAASAGGCLNRPIEPVEPRTTSTVVERITQAKVDKIDILLAIDNSASMKDKQDILGAAVPDLVSRLVNPRCVDKEGNEQNPVAATSTEDCKTGYDREFDPIADINVGIISSSMGGVGSNSCAASAPNAHNDDKGELVHRGVDIGATYQSHGFLAWDPPPSKRGGIADQGTLQTTLTQMVTGVGQDGCGYEMQLESIYRFLVDPNPYDHIEGGDAAYSFAKPVGTDQAILDQRAQFLRANSLLAIIMLTDENDCSINTGSPDAATQNYGVLNSAPFFKGSPACATNPNDNCCFNCALQVPAGCSACDGNNTLAAADDNVNLRCWNQKKRYGFDALFPVQRYVNAFTQISIDPTNPTLAVDSKKAANAKQNPIFTDLSGQGISARDPGLVFFAGIVGVPWQKIARDPTNLAKGFKDFDELTTDDFFNQYVGDPDGHVEPTQAIMVESTESRGVPATEPNGGDRTIHNTSGVKDDLEYACIFPLNTPVPNGFDCTPDKNPSPGFDNPLCGADNTTQVNAKAYPGLRELAVIHGMAGQGITASVCPAKSATADNMLPDYGYRPAIGSIIERLKQVLGGQCLSRQLNADKDGNVPCIILEASHVDGGQGACDYPGRKDVEDTHKQAVDAALADPFAPKGPDGKPVWNNFCEIEQLAGSPGDNGSEKYKCQNLPDQDPGLANINGWCYLDVEVIPNVGDPTLPNLAQCPQGDRRLIRFVNQGEVQAGSTAIISCSGDTAAQ